MMKETGDRRQESGVRSQESGVRSQETGVRSRESGGVVYPSGREGLEAYAKRCLYPQW